MKKGRRKPITRVNAVQLVMKEISKNPSSASARKMITRFRLTAEELSESGMTYEVLRSLDGIVG